MREFSDLKLVNIYQITIFYTLIDRKIVITTQVYEYFNILNALYLEIIEMLNSCLKVYIYLKESCQD